MRLPPKSAALEASKSNKHKGHLTEECGVSIKQINLSISRNLALVIFWELLLVSWQRWVYCFSTFNGPEFLSTLSNEAKLFAKIFSEKSNWDDSGISLPVFTSRANLKLYKVTTKMIDLDLVLIVFQ